MITVNLYYTGTNGSARAFAEEMVQSGTAAAIRLLTSLEQLTVGMIAR